MRYRRSVRKREVVRRRASLALPPMPSSGHYLMSALFGRRRREHKENKRDFLKTARRLTLT
jgi:hypothetical protein